MDSARDICARLLQGPAGDDREQLLGAAVEDPECGPILLDLSRQALQTDAAAARSGAAAAVEIAARRGEPLAEALSGRLLGQSLRALGRHEDAVSTLQTAAEAARRGGDAGLAASVLIGAIDSLGMLDRFDAALSLAERLERELRAAGDNPAAARALVNAGGIHFRRDRFDRALDCYARAAEIFAEGPDPTATAIAWTNQANALTQLDRVEEALVFYERARAVFQEHSLTVEAAVVELNAGFLHYVSGRHTLALAALTDAHSAFVSAGRAQHGYRCAVDRGDVYRALNLHAEALADYDSAIAGFSSLPSDYDLARAEIGRAAVLSTEGRVTEAEDSLDRAMRVFQLQRNRLQRAFVLLVRSYLLHGTGRTNEATAHARSAQRVFSRQGQVAWAAEASLSAHSADRESPATARAIRRVARTARQTGRGWLECRAEQAIGRHYAESGRLNVALRHLRAGAVALERARSMIGVEQMNVAFVRDKLSIYEDLVDLLLRRGRRGDAAEALEWAERSRSRMLLERLVSSLGPVSTRKSVAGSSDEDLRSRAEALRAELSRTYFRESLIDDRDPRRRLGRSVTAAEVTRESIEAEYESVLRRLELAGPGARLGPASLSMKASDFKLRGVLSASETLLEYFLANGRLYVFAVRGHSVEARPLDCSPEAVEQALRKLRYHLQRVAATSDYLRLHGGQLRAGFDEALGRLYELLWRPVEDLLETEEVVVVPHGALHAVPFHALYDARRCGYVLERWEIVMSPSAAVRSVRSDPTTRREVACHAPGQSLLMGVPAPGLPQIELELKRLGGLLPEPRVLCGFAATLGAFREWAGDSRILHVATHAQFREDNPLFSGLRFADGWLMARDLYEMSLDCELATLSACSTGVSRVDAGDEQFGLVRGFLAAGARSVAVSLWPVEDLATATLMERFYRKLAQGMGKARALRSAQQEMREVGAHPAHWAAFTLVGER